MAMTMGVVKKLSWRTFFNSNRFLIANGGLK